MKFELPGLPYAYDALEPFIDARTMEIHYTKHHQAYTDKLNEALSKYPAVADVVAGKSGLEALGGLLKDLDAVPADIRTAVRNHGGGYYNHSLFWEFMRPSRGGENSPAGNLAAAVGKNFGDFAKFKEDFSKSATGVFGSGWAWLVADKTGALSIMTTPNQDSPVSAGLAPLLCLDAWEHAYYLKYQNKRADYIAAWWNVANWEEAESRYNGTRNT